MALLDSQTSPARDPHPRDADGVPDGRLPPAPARAARVGWLDAARGIGIVLVVAGHSLGGLMSAGLVSGDGPFGVTFALIYTFHMPLFFALSAMFLPERLARGYRRIVTSALVRIAYPYLVWGTVQLLVINALGRAVNTPYPFHWSSLVAILWSPPSHFWFLYALVLFQGAAILFHRFADLRIMLAAAVLARFLPSVLALPTMVDVSCRYWVYYAAAACCAASLRDRRTFDRVSFSALLAASVVWLGAVYLAQSLGGDRSLADVPAAVLGTLITLRLSLLAPKRLGTILVWLGMRSMPIFLLHVMVVAGVRIAFTRILHIDAPLPILAVAVALGLILPALFFDWARRRQIATMLGLD